MFKFAARRGPASTRSGIHIHSQSDQLRNKSKQLTANQSTAWILLVNIESECHHDELESVCWVCVKMVNCFVECFGATSRSDEVVDACTCRRRSSIDYCKKRMMWTIKSHNSFIRFYNCSEYPLRHQLSSRIPTTRAVHQHYVFECDCL